MSILDEIKEIKESRKALKEFGLTVGVVLVAIAVVLLLRRGESSAYWGAAGVLLIVLSFAAPAVLKPLNKIWMSLSIVLGWLMTRVILVVFFYAALTPIAVIVRLFNRDLLGLKIDRSTKSYWQKREKKRPDEQDYERQF